ncbi:hypothetical protein J3R30DRAFT_2375470 [Lentinula aciculospora]|uniref:Transmembrane protein n=1 Tax=Lentinula aciculospora TaxID=153920 RepID=A0A9W9AEE2_9AGAR|nr:hypothetical protein J3R30DRAFT_2375470 [Lentinula aciculospora]
MAALYLHNAIFIPETSDSNSQEHYPHTRTISSTTFRTIATDHSYPTEPLLHSTNSGSLAYQDLLSRQPGYSEESGEEWSTELSMDGIPQTTSKEAQDYCRQRSVRKKLRVLKGTRLALKIVLASWAVYNTARYFIAYTIYDSLQGETTAILLGTSTAMCFALLTCAAAVSSFQPHLIRAHIPVYSLLVVRTIFRYLAAFFLIAPTIVNLALVIIWRRSSVSELVPDLRCRLDADVVWSVTAGICDHTTAAQWLGLSIFRLIFTLIVVVLFLLVCSAYDHTRWPSQSLSQHRRRRLHNIRPDQPRPKSPPASASSDVPLNPRHAQSPHSAAASSPQRIADRSFRSSESSSMLQSSSSDDDESIHSSRLDQQRLILSSTPTLTPTPQSDRELNNFAERFRALVSQISRETDDALRFAQSEDAGNSEPALLPEDIYTDLPHHNNDDFTGGEYPPDDHVRILNGFVRRMPTIESLGSRELTSLASSRDQLHSLSRPPTRSVTEFTGSEPPSRANSLSLTAAIGGHGLTSTEMGELMDKIDKENVSVGTASQSASRSTFSYYTAPSVGRNSDSPIPLTPNSEHFPSSPTSGHSSSL